VPDGSFTKESPERGIGKICDPPSAIWAPSVPAKVEPEKFTDEEVEKFKAEWRAASEDQSSGTLSIALLDGGA
jgi:hypothetical protein